MENEKNISCVIDMLAENKKTTSYILDTLVENKKTTSYILDTLTELKQTTATLSKNQDKLFKQYEFLNKKIDDNYTKLDRKIFTNYQAIERNYNAIIGLQKDVKDLRTDIDTVYALEQDSRKKIQHIL